MDISQYLMILIPYNEQDEVEKQPYEIGNRDHRKFCQDMVKKYHLNHIGGESHIDYARTFNSYGFTVIFSSGARVDGKLFASIFLPENMSSYQIDFLYDRKEDFQKNYHEIVNLFETLVYTTKPLSYNSGYKDFRSLTIEAIINRNPNQKNGQILLYEELSKRKEEILKR